MYVEVIFNSNVVFKIRKTKFNIFSWEYNKIKE
jgi:hypothetical protein